MLNVDAAGLAILVLLALGTLSRHPYARLAGFAAGSGDGAGAVTVLAWIERSALMVLLIVVAVFGVGVAIWLRVRGCGATRSCPTNQNF
jgi:hypothetical protein